jgi:hypothetical protein
MARVYDEADNVIETRELRAISKNGEVPSSHCPLKQIFNVSAFIRPPPAGGLDGIMYISLGP